ncbi:hypothetical protein A2982_03935 [candidate division WWE3 bacterium RIFCSPLOWO2_01_FULL_39_13]|uniref:HTH cro/C1-type domain-containing protein n=1 Tax=candidate division WWE3 bacterium RIFCSPLOWO2_01_FULL_39_13 TaxID=1802624 RepID=A0A1F4V3V6_UNCKA|nr:MAG: hypothetical protein A2982_03935 [candidate division WWE3 bacterium RIFCSPLOWO2_01_FULL_39_13]
MSTSLIAKRIKTARKEAQLSQKELGKALSVSEKAVSSYESGRTIPPFHTLEKIAKKTSKPIRYFSEENIQEISLLSKLIIIEKQLAEIKKLLKTEA